MVKDRKVINQKYYAASHDAGLRKNDIKSILAGRYPWACTLNLGERELNIIRSLNAMYRTILEDKHGIELESLYDDKTAIGVMRLPDVKVIQPVAPPNPSCII